MSAKLSQDDELWWLETLDMASLFGASFTATVTELITAISQIDFSGTIIGAGGWLIGADGADARLRERRAVVGCDRGR